MQSDKMLAGRTNQMKEEKTKQLKEWKMADEPRMTNEGSAQPKMMMKVEFVAVILVIQC